MKVFHELVRMRVTHRRNGEILEVLAYASIDAKMQAAAQWGIPLGDVMDARVEVERAALESCG